MAAQTGQFARVTYNAGGTDVEVLKLREWSVSTDLERPDTTAAGDEWATHVAAQKSWEGEATCIDADPFWISQMGEMLTIRFYKHRDDTAPVFEGTATFNGEYTSPYDDVIEQSLSYTGSGPLTSPLKDAQAGA